MLKLIRNEIKKIIQSKKYMVSMMILVVIYIMMTYAAYSEAVKSKPESRINSNNTFINYLKSEKEDKSTTEKRKLQIEGQIKAMEMQNKQLEFEINNKSMDWHEKVNKDNERLKSQLQEAEKEQDFEAIAVYKQKIASNEYSLKNNIRITPDYEVTAFTILPTVNIFAGMLVMSLIIAVITADCISGEYGPATIKLLLTKPISRKKVLFIKFSAAVISCIVSFAILKLLIFIVIGVIFKFGNYKEPISFFTKYVADSSMVAKVGYGVRAEINSLKIQPILSITLVSEMFNCLYIITCTAFCFLISTITKKSSSSISLSVILIAIASVFEQTQLGRSGGNPVMHKIMPYFFSVYSSGEFTISGEITSKLGLSYVNTSFAVVILLIWAVVCYLLSNLLFIKRDILV